MVIDDKGGEVMHKDSKDSEKMTKWENFDIKGRNMKVRGSIKF